MLALHGLTRAVPRTRLCEAEVDLGRSARGTWENKIYFENILKKSVSLKLLLSEVFGTAGPALPGPEGRVSLFTQPAAQPPAAARPAVRPRGQAAA